VLIGRWLIALYRDAIAGPIQPVAVLAAATNLREDTLVAALTEAVEDARERCFKRAARTRTGRADPPRSSSREQEGHVRSRSVGCHPC
jgi:hypothetical protein